MIRLKIINTINQIKNIYSNGSFDIKKWKEYINSIDSKIEELCISDMKETIDTGLYYGIKVIRLIVMVYILLKKTFYQYSI